MRHRKANVKLGRTASHRDAMLRNMVTSLFEYGRIKTTLSKAKAVRPLADRLIGLAKGGKADLSALRRAAAVITKRKVLDKLFGEAGDRFADRVCGFTLMAKTGQRPGDAAPMVILELTGAGQARAAVGGQTRKPKAGGAGDRAKRVAQSARKAAAPPEEAAPAEEAAPPAEPPAEAAPVEEAAGESAEKDEKSDV
jgi:large subunit ribosomal protein L17